MLQEVKNQVKEHSTQALKANINHLYITIIIYADDMHSQADTLSITQI